MALNFKKLLGISKQAHQPGSPVVTAFAPSESGEYVTEETALRLATVQACVRVLSEDVAALPLRVYERTADGGKRRATETPLYNVLRYCPNPDMTAMAFRQSMMMNLLLNGNSYNLIEYGRNGEVIALYPIMSDAVTVQHGSDGAIVYRVNGQICPNHMMLHIPGLTFDGIMGLSPISYARETIGLGIAAQRFGAKFFGNGTHMGGTLTFPGVMNDETYNRVKEQFNAMYRGLQNAHGIAIIEEGGKFEKAGINPDDAQFLETRKYQRTEIAGLFRVPLHMIGDLEHATFSNIEHQDISYLQRSLTPWLVRIEQGLERSLFTAEQRSKYIIEHDTNNFLRGDTAARYQSYSIGIQNGILTPNEVRIAENMNPIEGGDTILLPLNMMQAGAISEASPTETSSRKGFDYSDFKSGSSRRAAFRAGNGANKALYAAFRSWMQMQVDDLTELMADMRSKRVKFSDYTDAQKQQVVEDVTRKINSYYANLSKGALPREITSAVNDRVTKSAAVNKAVRIAKENGSPLPDNWSDQWLNRWATNANLRLCKANEDEVLRILQGSKYDMKTIMQRLYSWPKERSDAMAANEAHLAENRTIVEIYKTANIESLWQSDPACCDMCQSMNYQTVTTLTPPLHKWCVCSVVPKLKGEMSQPRKNAFGTTYGIDSQGDYAEIQENAEIDDANGNTFKFRSWSQEIEDAFEREVDEDLNQRLFKLYGGNNGLHDWSEFEREADVTRINVDESDITTETDETATIRWYYNPDSGNVEYQIKKSKKKKK